MGKEAYEIKEILKEFKSKNGVPLFAYIGTWHGANRDEEIRYIERKDTREYISSFIENNITSKYSWDKTLDEEVKRLKQVLILTYFTERDLFKKGNYGFENYDKENNIKEIVSELKLLMKEKKKIDFNEDWGVGKVHYRDNKYVVELNVYCNLSFPLLTTNLDDVAKWLWTFSNNEEDIVFDNSKAMSIAFSKDMMSDKEKEDINQDYDKQLEHAFTQFRENGNK